MRVPGQSGLATLFGAFVYIAGRLVLALAVPVSGYSRLVRVSCATAGACSARAPRAGPGAATRRSTSGGAGAAVGSCVASVAGRTAPHGSIFSIRSIVSISGSAGRPTSLVPLGFAPWFVPLPLLVAPVPVWPWLPFLVVWPFWSPCVLPAVPLPCCVYPLVAPPPVAPPDVPPTWPIAATPDIAHAAANTMRDRLIVKFVSSQSSCTTKLT